MDSVSGVNQTRGCQRKAGRWMILVPGLNRMMSTHPLWPLILIKGSSATSRAVQRHHRRGLSTQHLPISLKFTCHKLKNRCGERHSTGRELKSTERPIHVGTQETETPCVHGFPLLDIEFTDKADVEWIWREKIDNLIRVALGREDLSPRNLRLMDGWGFSPL